MIVELGMPPVIRATSPLNAETFEVTVAMQQGFTVWGELKRNKQTC